MGAFDKYYKKANSIKSKKDKLTGILNDLDELYNTASSMIRSDIKCSSLLMKNGYDGLVRIAERAPSPYLAHYLSYYKSSIGQLAGLFTARAKAEFAYNFSVLLIKQADELDKFVKELEAIHKFAFSMVDHDIILSKNLPSKFEAHYKLQELYDEELMALESSSAKNKVELTFAHTRSTTAVRIKQSRSELGVEIAAHAKDLAGAYLVFMKQHQAFVSQIIKATYYMHELKSSKGNGDNILGLKTISGAQNGVDTRDNNAVDTVLHFTNGTLARSAPAKKAARARMRLDRLTKTWKNWAHSVKTNSHMIRY